MLINDASFSINPQYREIGEMPLKQDHSDIIMGGMKTKYLYYNFTTGKAGDRFHEVARDGYDYLVINFANKKEKGFFIEYNAKFDVIVVRFVQFDGTRLPSENEIRGWEKTSVNEYVVIQRDGYSYYYGNGDGKHLFLSAIDVYYSVNHRRNTNHKLNHFGHDKADGILKEFFGEFFCEKGLRFKSTSCYYLNEIIKRTPLNILSKQKEIDDFVDIPLVDIPLSVKYKVIDLLNPWKTGIVKMVEDLYHSSQELVFALLEGYYRLDCGFGIISKVKDGVSCIRVFQTRLGTTALEYEGIAVRDINKLAMDEVVRIYITDEKTFVCKQYSKKWVVCKSGLIADYFSFVLLKADDEAINNCRLKYYRNNIDSCIKNCVKDSATQCNIFYDPSFMQKARQSSILLMSMIFSPLYESIIKSGLVCYESVANDVFNDNMSIDSLMKRYFGDYNRSKTSFISAVGVPYHVFDKINDCWKEADILLGEESLAKNQVLTNISRAIWYFKAITKDNSRYMKHVDNKTFSVMMEWYKKSVLLARYSPYSIVNFVTALYQLVDMFGIEHLVSYLEQVYNIFHIQVKDCTKVSYVGHSSSEVNIYIDYVNMCYSLRNNIPLSFNMIISREELVTAHSNILELYNAISDDEKARFFREKYEQHSKRWLRLEYAEDEFSVVMPHSFQAIAKEGLDLHHCVKSYIEDVANGKTNIMFVRKSDDLETPFFTLEIKDNTIRQCHGFANCNTDTVDGLDEFLARYCENKKIGFGNWNMILACARG